MLRWHKNSSKLKRKIKRRYGLEPILIFRIFVCKNHFGFWSQPCKANTRKQRLKTKYLLYWFANKTAVLIWEQIILFKTILLFRPIHLCIITFFQFQVHKLPILSVCHLPKIIGETPFHVMNLTISLIYIVLKKQKILHGCEFVLSIVANR